ncbi:hypothetical protein GGH96_001867 [Coemansia sp. RSA 1972]|nr:hypothetical protein GGH96_001867 [Coemansia sp. RSA 1972]
MSADSNSQVVLVTGCSTGGIGCHLALELARRGCKVYASSRDTSKAVGLTEHGIQVLELDVTHNESTTAAVQKVLDEAGRIDILVNNAGLMCAGPVTDTNLDFAQRAFDTNVLGVARVCQAVTPSMIKRQNGLIVNIGSVSGYATTPWVGFYSASKAAVHAMSDAMRMELAPFNIKVVVVAPGGIQSNLAEHQQVELGTDSPFMPAIQAIRDRAVFSQAGNATPTDVFARVVVPRILASNPAPYITYGNHARTTWLLHYAPSFLRDWLYSRRFGTDQLQRKSCPFTGKSGALPDRVVARTIYYLRQGQTARSLVHLLRVCRQWHHVLVQQMCAEYELYVDARAHAEYTLWPAGLPQPTDQYFQMVTQLTITVDYNCIFNGQAVYAIFEKYSNQLIFPHAYHLILCVQHNTNDKDIQMHDYDSHAHVFAKYIKQMAPQAQKVTVKHSTFTEVREMPTDHSFDTLLNMVFRNTQYSAMLLNYNDFIYSYQPQISHSLSKLDCCWNENYKQMLPLIHTSAETLIELKLTCHGVSRDKLVQLFISQHNHYIIYYHLQKLVFAKSTNWEDIVRPGLGMCKFLPKLRHLYVGILYPFIDDLLFRGCSDTLEYLYITPDPLVLQMLDQYAVFSQGKFKQLRHIAVAETTYRDSHMASAVAQFVHRASPARTVNIVDGKAGEKFLCAAVHSHHMTRLQVLYIKHSQLTLADITAVLNAMPQLSELYCMCAGLGDEYSSVSFMQLAEHMHQNFYPLNIAFGVWEIVHNYSMPIMGIEAAKDMALCTMLLSVVCPNFMRARIGVQHKRSYNSFIKKTVALNPLGKFAKKFKELLQPL